MAIQNSLSDSSIFAISVRLFYSVWDLDFGMYVDLIETLDILDIIFWDSGSYLNFVLSGFIWYCFNRGKGTYMHQCYCQVWLEVQVFHLSSIGIQEPGGKSVPLISDPGLQLWPSFWPPLILPCILVFGLHHYRSPRGICRHQGVGGEELIIAVGWWKILILH